MRYRFRAVWFVIKYFDLTPGTVDLVWEKWSKGKWGWLWEVAGFLLKVVPSIQKEKNKGEKKYIVWWP